MLRSLIPRVRDRLYPDSASRDAQVRLRELLDAELRPDSRVLELGAGTGRIPQHDLKGRCAELVGADFDPRVLDNPRLDRGVVLEGDALPIEDASFDLAVSIAVLEHVERPGRFLGEVARVLRPGGAFVSLTPNRWHYVSLAAAVTPMGVHRRYNAWRGRPEADTFPTRYRLNTARALRRHGAAAGLELESLERIEVAPTYLSFSLPSYLLGVAWERAVNSTGLLAGLRVNLIATLRRPG